MFVASIFSHKVGTTGESKRVFVAVGPSKEAAESAMPEILENHGYTPSQISSLLDRMSTHPMGKKTHGWTQIINLPY